MIKHSLLCLLLLGTTVFADDRLRDVQTELKSQGFYFGEVDGAGGAETTAAIRRYQIRNGLEVTGDLSTETLASLGIGGQPAPPAPAAEPPAPVQPKPPVNLHREDSVEESDRAFLDRVERREQPQPQPARPAPLPPPRQDYDDSIVPPPAPIPDPNAGFESLYAGTPYATAPAEVQDQTLRRAQAALRQRGYYRDAVDGIPGPATEEALLTFQRSQRLPLTGRLDLQTLSLLRLLPGRDPIRTFRAEPSEPSTRVYRGVIVD